MKCFEKYLYLVFAVFYLSSFCLHADQNQEKLSDSSFVISNDIKKSTVIETMNSGGYTYILISSGGSEYWLAGKEFSISNGDTVEYFGGMEMRDFTSKTLNRTFKRIFFMTFLRKSVGSSGAVEKPSGKDGVMPHDLPEGHIPLNMMKADKHKSAEITVNAGDIEKADGGYTIEDCFTKKNALKGNTVVVQGVVVKFSSGILNRNWIHIKDGTGNDITCDLTVTSEFQAEKGDIIEVTGTLGIDRDFGAGYFYPVIIENASIKKIGVFKNH